MATKDFMVFDGDSQAFLARAEEAAQGEVTRG